jgi:hypothetical protein
VRTLRPHQAKAIEALAQSLAGGHRRPMLQAPTGAGKTLLSASIIDRALRKGRRVTFTVPAISLVDQTVHEFWREGIRDVGVIQANHPMTFPDRPVQIASVQSLVRRGFPRSDLVIVDEAHRMFEVIQSWMGEQPELPFIGLSATPWSKGLGKYYDDLIIAATTKELIEAGYLSRFRVFAPSHPDLTGVRTVAGDYHEGELSGAMQPLTADVVATWLEHGNNLPTLCFAVDCAHAKHLHERFDSVGVSSAYIDASTDLLERERIRKGFHSGEYKVVCNVGVMTTGVDWDVRCLILARPTKSEILYTQIIGRGLRTAEGKTDCLARGTRILTDRGSVNIEHLTLHHKVWDGVDFVAHAGAVCKGVRPVISYDGITATPNHKVMTNVGWLSLAQAHRRGVRIARTGLGRLPLRFSGDCVSQGGRYQLQSVGGGAMRPVFAGAHGPLSQHQKETGNGRLSALQWTQAGDSAAMAISALSSSTGSVLQSCFDGLRELWRARHRVQVFRPERGGHLGGPDLRCARSVNATRSGGQRWTLRAGKSALGSFRAKYEQHPCLGGSWPLHRVQVQSSRYSVCGPDSGQIDQERFDRSTNHQPLERPIVQAEGEVWDVLNAGRLQRFTANGRLVHNCTILDHSDTTMRLGFVTDILHDKLDDGTTRNKPDASQDRTPALPKECPKCTMLRPVGSPSCPNCGFKPDRQAAGVEVVAGALVEMDGRAKAKANREAGWDEKVAFIAELRCYANQTGKKPGWVAHQYRSRWSVWPNDPRVRDAAASPFVSPKMQGWIRSRSIAWAKSRDGVGAAQ